MYGGPSPEKSYPTPPPPPVNGGGSPARLQPGRSYQRSYSNDSPGGDASSLFSRPSAENSGTEPEATPGSSTFPVPPGVSRYSSPQKQSASALFASSSPAAAVAGNNSSMSTPQSATALFASPVSTADSTPAKPEMTVPTESAAGPYTSSSPAPAVVSENNAAPNMAAHDLFGASSSGRIPPPPNAAASTPCKVPAGGAAASDEEDLDDIPLTPGGGPHEAKPSISTAMNVNTSSLVASIGMPPPPFSKK
jgi:hypothetical protein